MKFSTKAEYGLRAILYLAKNDQPVSLALIAKEEKISLSYLERIFAKLKKFGLVTSVKGAKGGYLLAKSAKKIKVAEVVRALEGLLYKLDCNKCGVKNCKARTVWCKLSLEIHRTLNSMTLHSLIVSSE